MTIYNVSSFWTDKLNEYYFSRENAIRAAEEKRGVMFEIDNASPAEICKLTFSDSMENDPRIEKIRVPFTVI